MSRAVIGFIAGVILGFGLSLFIEPAAAQMKSDDFKEMMERGDRADAADALQEIAAQLQYQNLVRQQVLPPSTPKSVPTAVDMEIHGGYVGILWSDGRIVRQRWADIPMKTP